MDFCWDDICSAARFVGIHVGLSDCCGQLVVRAHIESFETGEVVGMYVQIEKMQGVVLWISEKPLFLDVKHSDQINCEFPILQIIFGFICSLRDS